MTIYSVVIAKTGDVLSFDTDKLPKQSVEYATDYGFRQSMNDACAGIARKDYDAGPEGDAKFLADAREKVTKREAQVRSGNVPGSRVTVSPVAILAAQMQMTEEEFLAVVEAGKAKKAADKAAAEKSEKHTRAARAS